MKAANHRMHGEGEIVSTTTHLESGNRTRSYAYAVASGVLGTLAYPASDIWPLAWVMYVPLLLSLRDATTWKEGFLRGWTTGIVLHLGSFYWIYHTMISMSDLPPSLAALACLLFGLYSGLQQGVFAACVPWVMRRGGGHVLWMIPVLFTLFEKGFPHVFPWHLGNVLYEVPLLVQTADLVGVYGNTFLLFLSSVLALHFVLGSAGSMTRKRAGIAWISLWVCVAIYGGIRLHQVDEAEVVKELRIGLVQANITPEDKKQKGIERRIIYEKGQECMGGLDEAEVDLIVWPEGGYPYYFPQGLLTQESHDTKKRGSGYAGRLQDRVKERGVDFVFGALTKPEQSGKKRNSFIHLNSDGVFERVHDKQILVPFGEYVPFSDWFPALKGKVKGIGDMSPGNQRVIFDIGGVQVLPSICYEAIYPESTRLAATLEPRAEMLLNITNDMWFGDTSALNMHLMVQTSRAVELRIPLVRSTNSGISAFIDAGGRISGRTPRYESLVREGVVQIKPLFSLYALVGDLFLGIGALLMLGLCVFSKPQ